MIEIQTPNVTITASKATAPWTMSNIQIAREVSAAYGSTLVISGRANEVDEMRKILAAEPLTPARVLRVFRENFRARSRDLQQHREAIGILTRAQILQKRKAAERRKRTAAAAAKRKAARQKKPGDVVPIGAILNKAISNERNPDLFNPEKQPDKEGLLSHLLKSDAKNGLQRRGKPIVLNHAQQQVILYIQYLIGRKAVQGDQEVIERFRGTPIREVKRPNGKVTREREEFCSLSIDITEAAQTIYGRAKHAQRERFTEAVRELCEIDQVFSGDFMGRHFNVYIPLIKRGARLAERETSGDPSNIIDTIKVDIPQFFFQDLDKRNLLINPNIFDVWRGKGRQCELYGVLQAEIFSIYWVLKTKTRQALKELKEKRDYKAANPAQRLSMENAIILMGMTYKASMETIKKKVARDYEGNRKGRIDLSRDLTNAMKGYQEAGLIEGYEIDSKGVKMRLNWGYHPGKETEKGTTGNA